MRVIEQSVIDAMREYQRRKNYPLFLVQFYPNGAMDARLEKSDPPQQIDVYLCPESNRPDLSKDIDDEFRKFLSSRLKY